MRFLLFFIPYLISLLYQEDPETKYWICWGGSFWIFWVTFAGWAGSLPRNRPFAQQFMRPFIFAHLLLAGYMVLSSVFFFLHYHGYYYFEQVDVPDPEKIVRTAQCQQYYQLAHAALATGFSLSMRGFERPRFWAIVKAQNADVFFKLTWITFLLQQVLDFLPFGSAFKSNLNQIALLSSLLFLIQAFAEKKKILLALGLFAINILLGTLSGMKSATLMIILFLGAQYYGRYRWQTITLGALSIWVWFSFIPTISVAIRQQAWFGGQNSTQVLRNAIADIRDKKVDSRKVNWNLLVARSSEVGMFIRYVDHVPIKRDFYGLEIVEQALMGLIPRAMRPDGKSIDETAMARAIEVGIIDRKIDQSTSAKPALVADAYMSGAELAIIITFLVFGYMANSLAQICERFFGGYTFGTVLIFNGCFAVFQTGSCFENVPSSIFYGIITMYFIFFLLVELKILQRVPQFNLSRG